MLKLILSKCSLETLSEGFWSHWPAERLLTVSGPFLDEMSYFFLQSKTFFGPDLLAIKNLILQEVM